MGVPSGTFTTYATTGIREDLEDMIYDISPMDTPFMSNIPRGKTTQKKHEWQTDALATAANNAQIEGNDAVLNTATATTRFANYTQISWKIPAVTGANRASNAAGRGDEMSYQVAKRARELKRDMEVALCGASAATAGAAASARRLAGLGLWLWNNDVKEGALASTVTVTSGAPSTAPTAGTAGTFTEAQLQSCISLCWTAGGDPGLIMVGSWNKRRVSGFSGVGTQYRDASPNGPLMPGSIVGAADVYVSDYGTHQVVANRFQPAATVYVLDLGYWECAYLRPIQQTDLAKTGDSDKKMILTEFTLVARNPSSSGKVFTTTTS